MIVFLLTPWVFITVLSIAVILELIFIETEKFGWSTIIFLGSLALINLHYDLLGYVMNHPLSALLLFGIYFVVGILWSIGKWYFKVNKEVRNVKNLRKKFLKEFNDGKVSDTKKTLEAWVKYLNNSKEWDFSIYATDVKSIEDLNKIIKSHLPEAANNKSKIIAWISFWPFSSVATILNDPIRRIATEIYERLNGVFGMISNKLSQGIDKME